MKSVEAMKLRVVAVNERAAMVERETCEAEVRALEAE